MADTAQLIKEKLDVGDFIKQYVQLHQAGKNLKGLCPFHKEKTPSFIVSPDKAMWHCFGCGQGGDVITFLMKYENLEFIEALKILADKAGIELRLTGSSDQKQFNALYEINRIAKTFYIAALKAEQADKVREYLSGRGLKQETIDEFEIGLSGSQPDGLIKFLTKKGFNVTDIERAGLAYKNDRGMYRDRFNSRIMFPLHNSFGKVVGFTGRVLPWNDDGKSGKYVNSPETPIFNKSKLLFGFDHSKNFIREANAVVLVEGQMDFLMIWQDGVKNAIATSGTALTIEHLRVLRRLAENIVLSFDNDNAGRAAAERTIDLASGADFNVKVLSFNNSTELLNDKDLKDPADIVRAKPGMMTELIAKAKPAMEYYFEYYGVGGSSGIAEKKKAIRAALQKIQAVASPVEKAHWFRQLASRTGVPEDVIAAELATLKIDQQRATNNESPQAETPEVFTRGDVIVQRLLSLILIDTRVIEKASTIFEQIPEAYQKIWKYLLKQETALELPLKKTADLIHLRASLEPSDPEKITQECDILIAALQMEQRKDRRKMLRNAIAQAEAKGDESRLEKLLSEYQKLAG